MSIAKALIVTCNKNQINSTKDFAIKWCLLSLEIVKYAVSEVMNHLLVSSKFCRKRSAKCDPFLEFC